MDASSQQHYTPPPTTSTLLHSTSSASSSISPSSSASPVSATPTAATSTTAPSANEFQDPSAALSMYKRMMLAHTRRQMRLSKLHDDSMSPYRQAAAATAQAV